MFNDDEKVGLIIFIKNYTEEDSDIFGNIGYLILDESLGEYDVEMKIGFIEFHSFDSKYFENSKNISDLAQELDNHYK